MDRLLASPRLPSLPAIAIEVIDLVQREDVSIDDLARTVQNDPALAGKILKTANSCLFARAQPAATISQALVMLGLNSVKTLALGFTLVSRLGETGGDGFDHMRFWRRSLYTGSAARQLAPHLGQQQEEAFLGGLLQDLGMLVMHQVLGERYESVLRAADHGHARLVAIERDELGLDHTQVGAALAGMWRLPRALAETIRHHESPDEAEGPAVPLIRLAAMGNAAASIFLAESQGAALEQYYERAERWAGLPREAAEPLLRQAHEQTKETRRLFDLPTGELGNPDEILARANEALLQISLASSQQANQLEQENRRLAEEASTDALTGTANRRRFNDYIACAFEQARREDRPMSLILLDADHFKHFNDQFGHPTGDRVLVELSQLLMERVPEGALVSRYGGEEFAVVLPGLDRTAAGQLAESIRRELAVTPVESDTGEIVQVTASMGVACYEPGVFDSVDQLVRAADQGVYAAKSSGRNCVRVFRPRVRESAA